MENIQRRCLPIILNDYLSNYSELIQSSGSQSKLEDSVL